MFKPGFRLLALAFVLPLMVTALPAAAQDKGPFGGFKHDATAPIEIEADSLEVHQAEKTATFQGQVIAGQGTLRLTADKVTVAYDGGKSEGGTGKIQSMRAEGNVFLSNGSETAKGAWAEYDVANGMMRMGGKVVLTQGDNALSGESLVINLNEGTGRIEGGRVVTKFTPAQGN